ncbi:hypothetical protein [Persicitalea sp.]|uniref:hypothetical protein n=1 Tax=Persicitalea sp. TaxID=3100273 RepID=UPI003594910B
MCSTYSALWLSSIEQQRLTVGAPAQSDSGVDDDGSVGSGARLVGWTPKKSGFGQITISGSAL